MQPAKNAPFRVDVWRCAALVVGCGRSVVRDYAVTTLVCLFVFTPDTSKLGSGLRLGIEVELEWQVEVVVHIIFILWKRKKNINSHMF